VGGQTFTDPRLAAAVVDRLTFNAHIIQTGTQSLSTAREYWFWPTFRDQTDPGSVAGQATMPGM